MKIVGFFQKKKKALIIAGCLILCIAAASVFGILYRSRIVVPGNTELQDDYITPEGTSGEGEGSMYAPKRVKTDCILPDGETFYFYQYAKNTQMEAFLRQYLQNEFEFAVLEQNNSSINYNTDSEHVLLRGDLSMGMFEYQLSMPYEELYGARQSDFMAEQTKEKAEQIAASLATVTGKLTLKESRVVPVEVESLGYTSAYYDYIFVPEEAKNIHGSEIETELYLSFTSQGIVCVMRNDINQNEAVMYQPTEPIESIQALFAEEVTVAYEHATVTITGYRIYYQTMQASDDSYICLAPVLELKYRVKDIESAASFVLEGRKEAA